MDEYTIAEEAYKNGYAKGLGDGKKVQREIILCINCLYKDIVEFPNNKVWCNKMCRYMNKDSFCSEGSVQQSTRL